MAGTEAQVSASTPQAAEVDQGGPLQQLSLSSNPRDQTVAASLKALEDKRAVSEKALEDKLALSGKALEDKLAASEKALEDKLRAEFTQCSTDAFGSLVVEEAMNTVVWGAEKAFFGRHGDKFQTEGRMMQAVQDRKQQSVYRDWIKQYDDSARQSVLPTMDAALDAVVNKREMVVHGKECLVSCDDFIKNESKMEVLQSMAAKGTGTEGGLHASRMAKICLGILPALVDLLKIKESSTPASTGQASSKSPEKPKSSSSRTST